MGGHVGRLNKLGHRYRSVVGLGDRLNELEAEIQECRQLNLRLAELCDVMMELLLPASTRDEKEVEAILARYRADVSEPLRWRSGD
jgi:Domain of unknown function (DUF6752)